MAHNKNRWTPEQDAIVVTLSPRQAAPVVGHSWRSCAQRKSLIMRGIAGPAPEVEWTDEHVKRLRKIYPTADRKEDLTKHFPGMSAAQIRGKAAYLKIRKIYSGDPRIPSDGHMELVDQIRVRCKQDGIAISKMDKILGTKRYFGNTYKNQGIRLRAIAKAVEFFGGTLVIDWRDR